MKHSIVMKSQTLTEHDRLEDLQQSMEIIEDKLDREIISKQHTIERQEDEIQRLHRLVEEKNRVILDANEKLVETMRGSEGSRQLINKLLNDIERLQHDIEWYKRTYEKRSLLGTIRQKIAKK